jgi:hypothetical protein
VFNTYDTAHNSIGNPCWSGRKLLAVTNSLAYYDAELIEQHILGTNTGKQLSYAATKCLIYTGVEKMNI